VASDQRAHTCDAADVGDVGCVDVARLSCEWTDEQEAALSLLGCWPVHEWIGRCVMVFARVLCFLSLTRCWRCVQVQISPQGHTAASWVLDCWKAVATARIVTLLAVVRTEQANHFCLWRSLACLQQDYQHFSPFPLLVMG